MKVKNKLLFSVLSLLLVACENQKIKSKNSNDSLALASLALYSIYLSELYDLDEEIAQLSATALVTESLDSIEETAKSNTSQTLAQTELNQKSNCRNSGSRNQIGVKKISEKKSQDELNFQYFIDSLELNNSLSDCQPFEKFDLNTSEDLFLKITKPISIQSSTLTKITKLTSTYNLKLSDINFSLSGTFQFSQKLKSKIAFKRNIELNLEFTNFSRVLECNVSDTKLPRDCKTIKGSIDGRMKGTMKINGMIHEIDQSISEALDE